MDDARRATYGAGFTPDGAGIVGVRGVFGGCGTALRLAGVCDAPAAAMLAPGGEAAWGTPGAGRDAGVARPALPAASGGLASVGSGRAGPSGAPRPPVGTLGAAAPGTITPRPGPAGTGAPPAGSAPMAVSPPESGPAPLASGGGAATRVGRAA